MNRFGFYSRKTCFIACSLFFSNACRDTDKASTENARVPEIRLGQEAFRISGDLSQEASFLKGSGSVQSTELLAQDQNTFELEFSLPKAQSSLALNLFSRPAQAEGLNIRFYEKNQQLETFTDFKDADGQVVSVMQNLGPYTIGQTLKLRLTVKLSASQLPQIETSYVIADQEEKARLEFSANAEPFAVKYYNWGIYLGDAQLSLANH
jgi:hypothetical protein